jgi:hypothetical protein
VVLLHYLFQESFIQTPGNSEVFQELELPEEEIVGEDLESIIRARNLYIKPKSYHFTAYKWSV